MPANTNIVSSLSAVLGEDLFSKIIALPNSRSYEESNDSYFSALARELKPCFILQPSTNSQVQDILCALHPHILKDACRLAIRGTGHTPFAGGANIQDGVTLDLGSLKGITLSADKSTIEIGVCETWGAVYTELAKYGLTTAGAPVSNVGVGGFLLGGGLSILSSSRGFACDSVTEFQVVLASGKLVRANAAEYSDLFMALKGGLSNFGIATSITMNTYTAGDIWGGIVYYPPDAFADLFQSAFDFVHHETDENARIMCSAGYGYGQIGLTCVMYHTHGEVNPPSLKRFTSIQPQVERISVLKTSTALGFANDLGQFSSSGKRQYWVSITIRPDFDLIQTFYDKWQHVLTKVKDAEGLTFSFGFQPLTKSLLKHSQEAGGNAMDISPADGPLFIVLINPVWTNPADDNRIFAAIEEFLIELRQIASERGLLHRYIFANYAYWKDDVMAGYGTDSIERMKAVSAKYDPEGLFQKGVPGGFKLPL